MKTVNLHVAKTHLSRPVDEAVAGGEAIIAKVRLGEPVGEWMPRAIDHGGFTVLEVTLEHAIRVADLPLHHADPFDRLLIAQAQLEELTIVTSDTAFDPYDVETLDARR